MPRVLGIDLGTTNSCAAVLEGDTPLVVPAEQGQYTLPSIVGFESGGRPLVGNAAKRQAVVNAGNTVFAAKRLMGLKFDDGMARRAAEAVPYKCVQGPHNDIRVKVHGKVYSLPEISAFILSELKRAADQHLSDNIEKAVITVPAYFNDHQRQATRDAGRIAGLDVLRVLNEPTAAALAYGALQHGEHRRVLVYDLGGGTFDVSVLEIRAGEIDVRATAGDPFLGGRDFDDRVLEWLTTRIEREHGLSLASDRNAMQRLREASENAKIELSERTSTQIALPFLTTRKSGDPVHVDCGLERAQFEALVADLVDRTMTMFVDTIRAANLTPEDVDEVILVGGMTRVPAIQRRVADRLGREPSSGVHPDLVVAVGAAMQGAMLEQQAPSTILRDVTPHNLGIMALGGLAETIIPKDSAIPTNAQRVFTTVKDDQEQVRIVIYQGQSRRLQQNQILGELTLQGIRKGPRGTVQIEVSFSISVDGIVAVSAKDVETGREQHIELRQAPTLNEGELQQMTEDHRNQLQSAAQAPPPDP